MCLDPLPPHSSAELEALGYGFLRKLSFSTCSFCICLLSHPDKTRLALHSGFFRPSLHL